ncbi:MAG: ketoacyl-ACP synthase III [Myxococcaceae bacterium]|nr:ketoacyl-ACP synthase III [Myxococcaceae bacterium]
MLTVGPFDDFGVLGAGTAFPSRVVTNLEVLRGLPAEAWGNRARVPDGEQLEFAATAMEQTLGVRERTWSVNESTLDLAKVAASRALADAGLKSVDLVVVASSTPHRWTSTLSAPLGASLGLSCPCFDVRTGCAAGLFGLAQAGLFHEGGARHVLLVGTETFSKVIPRQSKMAAVSLADGAGALVLGPVSGARLRGVSMNTDGSLAGLVYTSGALPPTREEIERGGYVLSGDAEGLRETVPLKYEAAIRAVLERAGLGAADVDAYVPHQTSKDVIHEVCRRLGIPTGRAFMNLHRHANIGAAGWVVAVAEARAETLKQGQRVLIAAVGGGMSWGAALWEW